jgi:hypothetical protein
MALQDRIYDSDLSAVKRDIDWSKAEYEIEANRGTLSGLMELVK